MPPSEEESASATALGQELRRARELHGLTLRAVEQRTGLSNAYLSQLETGKIAQPSPNVLYKLSEAYGVPYELLMERAGYIARQNPEQHPRRSLVGAALSAIEDLTPEEEEALADFLAFLRYRAKGSAAAPSHEKKFGR